MPSGYPFLTIFIFYPQEATCKDQGLNQTYLFKLGLTGKEATPIFENFFALLYSYIVEWPTIFSTWQEFARFLCCLLYRVGMETNISNLLNKHLAYVMAATLFFLCFQLLFFSWYICLWVRVNTNGILNWLPLTIISSVFNLAVPPEAKD